VITQSHNGSIQSECVELFLKTRISFRGIGKVVKHLNPFDHIPHFTSVINWVLRFGLSLLQQAQPISAPWIAMIDHSIDIGSKKVLVVLRVKVDVFESTDCLQLTDCECLGLHIQQTINGHQIAIALMAIFEKTGYPQVILQDGDSSLNCGVKRLLESRQLDIPIVHDISHAASAALKQALTNHPDYQTFLDLRVRFNSQFRQTDCAYLLFPKIRHKGRFMDIGKQFVWATHLLQIHQEMSNPKLTEQFNGFQQKLFQLQEFIDEFADTTDCLNQMMKQLKMQGLNDNTFNESKHLLNPLPDESSVKTRLLQWLEQTYAISKQFSSSLPVSSDVIESLFGLFKYLVGRNPQADMNRSVLLLPALCGQSNLETIQQAISQTCHMDLQGWITEHVPETIRQARNRLLA